MKEIINLTSEQKEMLSSLGHVVSYGDNIYYHLPQWYKESENGRMEVLNSQDLPKEIQKEISHFTLDEVIMMKGWATELERFELTDKLFKMECNIVHVDSISKKL